MQKPFVTQPEFFVLTDDFDLPAQRALDDTEAVLDWSKTKAKLPSIYAFKKGAPAIRF